MIEFKDLLCDLTDFHGGFDDLITTISAQLLKQNPATQMFVVPDDAAAPDFHSGDICWHVPSADDGWHVLEDFNGKRQIGKIYKHLDGKISIYAGENKGEFKESYAPDGLYSLGRCVYAHKQVLPRERHYPQLPNVQKQSGHAT